MHPLPLPGTCAYGMRTAGECRPIRGPETTGASESLKGWQGNPLPHTVVEQEREHTRTTDILFPPEQILSLHEVVMCVRQVIFPVQEGAIRPCLIGQAVRAHLNPESSPLVHILVVLPHVLSLHSTPALGAQHLLPHVTSSSGHPSGFGIGWLSGWQFVRLARLN